MVRHDPGTGEVQVGERVFDMGGYLDSISSAKSFEHQQALALAYDRACASLIGPNDVQKDGNREFKKKSAWRKLARHFSISVHVAQAEARIEHYPDGSWIAIVSATAVGPWGQSFTDVAACGSDEQTGRRVITLADAIATASTRASNRAISNLIAMGEVSAEEIGDRNDAPRSSTSATPAEPAKVASGIIPDACTKCGGPIYDNRLNKKSAKAPDWKCKNAECKDDRGYTTGGWRKPDPAAEVKPAPAAGGEPRNEDARPAAKSAPAGGAGPGMDSDVPPPDDPFRDY